MTSTAAASAIKKRKKLLLFIHGLGAGQHPRAARKYWKDFDAVAHGDAELTEIYDIDFFFYPSSVWSCRRSTSVPESAAKLHSELNTTWKDYDTVDVIAHSQGGLVTQRYIVDRVKSKEALRIGRAIFYDTPNVGSALGKGTEYADIGYLVSREARDLAPGSEMFENLRKDEKATGAHLVVPIRFVVIGTTHRNLVDRTSSWGIGHPGDYWVIPDSNHSSIKKPKDQNDPIYLAAKTWLLDSSARSGDDPPLFHDQPEFSGKQSRDINAQDRTVGRFTYWSGTLPFAGRSAELQELVEFLDDEDLPHFSWKLLCGSGGMGKSRLALELVKRARAAHWRAGFLERFKDEEYWSRWEPSRPTLLVVDYAAGRVEDLRKMQRGLAERRTPPRRPVRVLLIERDPEDSRLREIWADAPHTVGGSARKKDLLLKRMDVQHIFHHVLGGVEKVAQADQALSVIDDAERRPLYAYLIADALANGKDVRGWDRNALLADLITRERTEFWAPRARALEMGKREVELAETALALATMVGGLPVGELPRISTALLPKWDARAHSELFKAMTGKKVQGVIPAMEPDLVGEFFVLETLKSLGELEMADGETLAREFVFKGWQISGLGTYQFFDRVRKDFPDSGLSSLVLEPPNDAASMGTWGLMAAGLTHSWIKSAETKDDAIELYARLEDYVSLENKSADLSGYQGLAASHLLDGLARETAHKARLRRIGSELATILQEEPLVALVARDEAGQKCGAEPSGWEPALRYYTDLYDLCAKREWPERLRGIYSHAAAKLVGHLRTDSAMRDRAAQICLDLGELAKGHADDRRLQAHSVLAKLLLMEGGADEPDFLRNALQLYGELKTLAHDYPNDRTVRRAMARGAFELASYLGEGPENRSLVWDIDRDLDELSRAYPNDGDIRRLKDNIRFLHALGPISGPL